MRTATILGLGGLDEGLDHWAQNDFWRRLPRTGPPSASCGSTQTVIKSGSPSATEAVLATACQHVFVAWQRWPDGRGLGSFRRLEVTVKLAKRLARGLGSSRTRGLGSGTLFLNPHIA